MSLVIDGYQLAHTKQEFEIYDVKANFNKQGNIHIVLPVALKDFREFKKFYSELSKLGNKLELKDLGSDGVKIGIIKGDTGLFSKNKKTAYVTYRGDGKSFTELGTCPSQSNTWLLDSESVIDTIIRTTSLGQLLDEYQMRKFGVSKQEALRRREELTPNADLF